MDAFKDFFSELKERLHSPFIGSYCISWIIIYYPIPVALFFYTQKDLERDHYTSLLDLIKIHQSWWYMAALPLLIATLYTFGFPKLKYYITTYIARIALKTKRQIDIDAANSTVSIGRYRDILKKSKQLEAELSDLIADEKKLRRKIHISKIK